MQNNQEEQKVGTKRRFNFTLVSDQAIDDSKLSQKGILTLLALSRFADKNRTCYPSLKTLSEKGRCSVSTIQRGIEELVKYGYLVKETNFIAGESWGKDKRRSCDYEIIDVPGAVLPQENKTPTSTDQDLLPQETNQGEKEKEKREGGDPPDPILTILEEGQKRWNKFSLSQNHTQTLIEYIEKKGNEGVLQVFREQFLPSKGDKLNIPGVIADMFSLLDKLPDKRKPKVPVYCEYCGEEILTSICQNRDCPQYIQDREYIENGFENLKKAIGMSFTTAQSSTAEMVENYAKEIDKVPIF